MGKRMILASTGTLVGRINGYDITLVSRIFPPLIEEGLIKGGELMMLNSYYDRMDAVAAEWKHAGISFPVLHCEKDVGTFFSDAGAYLAAGATEESAMAASRALFLFRKNCEMAAKVGACRMVLHLWGGKNSDHHLDYNRSALMRCREITKEYGIRLLIENIPSAKNDPYANWRTLLPMKEDVGLIYDTRFGNLHRQMEAIWSDRDIVPHIEHIHISDHLGAERDFTSLRPILHPGEGMIDFDRFAAILDGTGYSGTITLESPVILEGGADGEKLRRTLLWLNERF